MSESYPENTETTLYIRSSYDGMHILDLIDQVEIHFGESINNINVNIRSEKIHTRCIGYDLYDGSDWDDYIIIERV